LGLHFSTNLTLMPALNYQEALTCISKKVEYWKKRNLTPLGKITVIKTFILGKFNHLFISLPLPSNQFIKQINDLLFKYLWDNKPDRIRRSQITSDYAEGGLKMVNLENFIKALKATWIRRLMISDAPWVLLFEILVCPRTKIATLGPHWCQILHNKIQNDFWKETLQSWFEHRNYYI